MKESNGSLTLASAPLRRVLVPTVANPFTPDAFLISGSGQGLGTLALAWCGLIATRRDEPWWVARGCQILQWGGGTGRRNLRQGSGNPSGGGSGQRPSGSSLTPEPKRVAPDVIAGVKEGSRSIAGSIPAPTANFQ